MEAEQLISRRKTPPDPCVTYSLTNLEEAFVCGTKPSICGNRVISLAMGSSPHLVMEVAAFSTIIIHFMASLARTVSSESTMRVRERIFASVGL